MSVQFTNSPALVAIGAFLLGWLLASVSARLIARRRAAKRDPRDKRIYALEAELRVVQAKLQQVKSEAEEHEQSLKDTTHDLEAQYSVIEGQQAEIDRLADNLKGSVLKTRELRKELVDRAAQNAYAEAKIREVEIELSLVQASADMLATGAFGDFAASENDAEPDEARAATSNAAR